MYIFNLIPDSSPTICTIAMYDFILIGYCILLARYRAYDNVVDPSTYSIETRGEVPSYMMAMSSFYNIIPFKGSLLRPQLPA